MQFIALYMKPDQNNTTNTSDQAVAKVRKGPKPKAPELLRLPAGLLITSADKALLGTLQTTLGHRSRNDTLEHCIQAAQVFSLAQLYKCAVWHAGAVHGWTVQFPDGKQVQAGPHATILEAMRHALAMP